MNIKEKRKKINKENFGFSGAIVSLVLGAIGLLIVYYSKLFSIRSFSDLYDCFYENGIPIIFGSFFFIVCLWTWIKFFLNTVISPKKEILYLHKNEHNEVYFYNKRGKKFPCNVKNKKENCYYFVLKTHDYIYEVLEECNEPSYKFPFMEKKSYWLNFYTPVGNFENMFVLPIVYIILSPGLLYTITTPGYRKLFAILYCVFPMYYIIYDFIYKLKMKKSNNAEVDDTFLLRFNEIIKGLIPIATMGIFVIIVLNVVLKINDTKKILMALPFVLILLSANGAVIAEALRHEKIKKLFLNITLGIFLALWFTFTGAFTVVMLKDGNYLYTLFSLPFWGFGIFGIYYFFIRKEK